MILDDALVAAGDEDEMLDAGFARLVDHVLDDRPVDDRQHFLGHRLGGRQEPRAEPGDRKDCLANFLHSAPLWSDPRRIAGLPDIFMPECDVTATSIDIPCPSSAGPDWSPPRPW